ncbi:DUF6274 family protein [Streptomyces griseocarneus]|uniref:DUF6274 family protein n=1 Tax=Streptomyces griseocarneus TaxID=51201 RepID=UPI00167E465D|nr:DUF6274 family protein [Streptomyces griseocarneus]MBZ6477813.1 DUF6274 family protein [Streptomyces griseocarneus]GHG58244.1 hypothetical protein GCM10018779_23660 [Streptomyces griseocarneus]
MTTTRPDKRMESIRHETRALLRAHLSAAVGYRHLTRHCPVCHRLLRLAQEAVGEAQEPRDADAAPR